MHILYQANPGTGVVSNLTGGGGGVCAKTQEKKRKGRRRIMIAIRAKTKASVGRSYLNSKSIQGKREPRPELSNYFSGERERGREGGAGW